MIAAVVLLAIIVVARNNNSSSTTSPTTPASSAEATSAAPAETSAAPAASSSSDNMAPAGSGPEGIVAHGTSTGATILWKAPATATGLTSYNVEASANGAAYAMLATVPASQLSLNITKGDSAGWTSFKVSAVYGDGSTAVGTTVLGKNAFGLPGQYK